MSETSIFERSGWLGTRARPLLNEWEHTRAATQVATQMMGMDEPATAARDIGRDVGNHTRELFVSCDPADALQQQFETWVPTFVAVHDVGARNARKLLAGISKATGLPVQRLVIRRQGYGTTLATIEFLDCEAADGRHIRLYATELDADTVTRVALARSLLAYSKMSVLLVADLPSHALAAALQPLRDAVLKGPWPSGHMLFMPLGVCAALPALVSDFKLSTAVAARTSPRVSRPAEAWSYLAATWNRIQEAELPDAADRVMFTPLKGRSGENAVPAGASAAPNPAAASSSSGHETSQGMMRLNLPPAEPAAAPAPEATVTASSRAPGIVASATAYVEGLSRVPGVEAACAWQPGQNEALASRGEGTLAEALKVQMQAHLSACAALGRHLQFGGQVREMSLTLGQHGIVLHAMPLGGCYVAAAVTQPGSHMPLLRLAMQKQDAELLRGAPGH